MMIDLIFNGLNLLLRFGLAVFLVRKYMVRRIAQSIVNEKEAIHLLDDQYTQIKDSCGALENNMKSQELLYVELQDKFAVWQRMVTARQQQELQKCAIQQKKLQEQAEKKQQYVQHRYVIEKELPGLVYETQRNLCQKFKQDQNLGKSYITKVLRALHE